MIARDALYSFVESLIDNAAYESPLYEAASFRNLRTSVDEAVKVVRVECFFGQYLLTEETKRQEANVQFTVQCWVLPDTNAATDEQTAIDTAVDLSEAMAREIFENIAVTANLNGTVCDAYAETFESGEANLGAIRRGVTYLDGVINQATT